MKPARRRPAAGDESVEAPSAPASRFHPAAARRRRARRRSGRRRAHRRRWPVVARAPPWRRAAWPTVARPARPACPAPGADRWPRTCVAAQTSRYSRADASISREHPAERRRRSRARIRAAWRCFAGSVRACGVASSSRSVTPAERRHHDHQWSAMRGDLFRRPRWRGHRPPRRRRTSNFSPAFIVPVSTFSGPIETVFRASPKERPPPGADGGPLKRPGILRTHLIRLTPTRSW